MTKRQPTYRLSRHAFWVSFVLCWGLLGWDAYAILVNESTLALSFAAIIYPLCFAFLAAMLGIHRAFGSVDYRAQTAAAATEPKPEGEGG